MGLNFTTQRKQVDVTLDDKLFILKEASGGTAVEYQNAALNGVTFGADGKPQRMVGQASVQSILVGGCLYQTGQSGTALSSSVGTKWVEENLPAKVMKALFKEAKEMSDLGEDEETAEEIRNQIKKLEDKLIKIENDSLGESTEDSEDGS